MNHQQDKSSNARSDGKKEDEPVLTGSLVSEEHPFEIKHSRACSGDSGAWNWVTSPLIGRSARDGSCEFNVLGQDTLLVVCFVVHVLPNGSFMSGHG